MLRNIFATCPITSAYISNCYKAQGRLFIIGGIEILYKERNTKGDPTAKTAYALNSYVILLRLIIFILQLKLAIDVITQQIQYLSK